MIGNLGRMMAGGNRIVGGLRTGTSQLRIGNGLRTTASQFNNIGRHGMRGRAPVVSRRAQAASRLAQASAGVGPTRVFAAGRTGAGSTMSTRTSGVRGLPGRMRTASNPRLNMLAGNPGSRRRSITSATGIGLGGILGANAVVADRPPTAGRNGLRPHSSGGASLF